MAHTLQSWQTNAIFMEYKKKHITSKNVPQYGYLSNYKMISKAVRNKESLVKAQKGCTNQSVKLHSKMQAHGNGLHIGAPYGRP
jgi:hypothetical protein